MYFDASCKLNDDRESFYRRGRARGATAKGKENKGKMKRAAQRTHINTRST